MDPLSPFFYLLIFFSVVVHPGDAGSFTLLTPLALILASYLGFESRASGLTIAGFLFCESVVMVARAYPDALTFESGWLKDLSTTCIPVLRQREEHLFQLMDSRAEKQKQLKPTHTSRLTRFDPYLVAVCITSVTITRYQAKDTVFPWGTRQFRRDRATARKRIQELKSEYKRASEEIESEIQECEAFLLKPTLPSVPQPEA